MLAPATDPEGPVRRAAGPGGYSSSESDVATSGSTWSVEQTHSVIAQWQAGQAGAGAIWSTSHSRMRSPTVTACGWGRPWSFAVIFIVSVILMESR